MDVLQEVQHGHLGRLHELHGGVSRKVERGRRDVLLERVVALLRAGPRPEELVLRDVPHFRSAEPIQ